VSAGTARAARAPLAGFLLSGEGWPYLLVIFIPLAVALHAAGAPAGAVFVTSALGIVPTAALMGLATDELATRAGPASAGC
jgi:Ca2+:H+ antiporter